MEQLRLDFVDVPWAQGLVDYYQPKRSGLREEIARSAAPTQTLYAMLAGYCETLGGVHYALGAPLSLVQACLGEAARAYLDVFLRRGTTPAIEYTHVEISPGPGILDSRLHRGPGEIDDSLTNSRKGVLAMHLALTAEGVDLARQIARLVWDPPGADYLAADSVIATPDDQHLAYSLKALLSGNARESLRESLRATQSVSEGIRLQTILVRAVASSHAEQFLGGLRALLLWHEQEARRNPKDPEFFLCFPALGMARIAVDAKLLSPELLPRGSAFFPPSLLSANSPEEHES